MQREIDTLADLLQQRLESLRQLALELDEYRRAFIDMDTERMHASLANQESLCGRIRRLDSEQSAVAKQASLSALDCDERLRELLHNSQAAQLEVRHLNRVNAQLVSRSTLTVRARMNLLANSTPTYGPENSLRWKLPEPSAAAPGRP